MPRCADLHGKRAHAFVVAARKVADVADAMREDRGNFSFALGSPSGKLADPKRKKLKSAVMGLSATEI